MAKIIIIIIIMVCVPYWYVLASVFQLHRLGCRKQSSGKITASRTDGRVASRRSYTQHHNLHVITHHMLTHVPGVQIPN